MFKRCLKIPEKIVKHGFVGSYRIIVGLLRHQWETRIPWPIKGRFYYHLLKLILAPGFQRKRILGIWDYKALPWSVGDPLFFIEMLSILKIRHNAEEIDICIVYDRDNPSGNRGRKSKYSNITSENAQDYVLEFLPLFSTSPYLGSIFQFNSRKEFYYFLRGNSERYDIFPPLGHHLSETYNYYGGTPHTIDIDKFFKDFGYIPHLRVGSRDKAWARYFYLKHLKEKAIPISLSLKQTSHAPERNALPSVWLSFIDKCDKEFKEVVFIGVGLREEIFDGLRERRNIIIAKDFGSSITEDFALIRTSFIYMGTNSGINTIAQFSDLPYLIFQFPQELLRYFEYRSDNQKVFSAKTKVTPELLFQEFKNLYLKLDRNKWYSSNKGS